MKSALLTSIFVITGLSLFSQSTFYRNIFGDRYPSANNQAPQFTALDTLSDGGYILSASIGPGAQFCTYMRLDSSFNTLWTKSYATTPSAALYNAAELDDHGHVGIFIDSVQTYFLKTNANGNVAFCKYYTLGPNGVVSTGCVKRSAEADSGFVSVLGECAMAYGIAKFDKYGETEWVSNYTSPLGFLGSNVYDLHPAFGGGYISTGQLLNSSDLQSSAIIIHSGNQGQVISSRRIQFDSAAGIHTRITEFTWSPSEQCYYATAGTFYGVPYVNHKYFYLLKLDTGLNVMNAWRINAPNASTEMLIQNMIVAADSGVVINGVMQDSTNGLYKFFMIKFDPATGVIEWSKSIRGITSPQWYFASSAIKGIGLFGPNNDILFGATVNNDGCGLASIHSDGTGLCVAIDTLITSSSASNWICRNTTINNAPTSFISYTRSLAILDETFNDSLFCGTWTSVPEPEKSEPTLFTASSSWGITTLYSASPEQLTIEVFSNTGQLILKEALSPYSVTSFSMQSEGMYIIRASNQVNSQTMKLIR